MLRFFKGIAGLSTAKTIFWKRSGAAHQASDTEIEGPADRPDVAPNPLEIYGGRRQPFARSCRRYFRIAAFPDQRAFSQEFGIFFRGLLAYSKASSNVAGPSLLLPRRCNTRQKGCITKSEMS
jgi:hypothetical protein